MNKIATNSLIGGFVISSTVEDKVQVRQVVANYTVGYTFNNYYTQNSTMLISNNNTLL